MNMLTKTTLAAVMLAAMAVSAQAQHRARPAKSRSSRPRVRRLRRLRPPTRLRSIVKPEVAQVNPAPAPEVVAPKAELAPAPAPEPKVTDPEGRAEIRCADHREAGPQGLRLFRLRLPRAELPLSGGRSKFQKHRPQRCGRCFLCVRSRPCGFVGCDRPAIQTAMRTHRRKFLVSLCALVAMPAGSAFAQGIGMSRATAFGFSFKGLDGGDIRLADYTGRPVLVVNTASLCGYTPQYSGLETLWGRYRARGLLVLGVPSNDFGGQEPGGATRNPRRRGQARRHLPAGRKGRGQGRPGAPVLSLGRSAAPGRNAALEFPQIPGRTRRNAGRRRSAPRWNRPIRESSSRSRRNCRRPERPVRFATIGPIASSRCPEIDQPPVRCGFRWRAHHS